MRKSRWERGVQRVAIGGDIDAARSNKAYVAPHDVGYISRVWLMILAISALFVLPSCRVGSLYAIYTENDLLYWPQLEGTWTYTSEADARITYQFERGSGDKEYRLTMRNGEESCVLSAHLTRIGKQVFIDARLGDGNPDRMKDYFLWPVHYFYMIELNGDILRARTMDSAWVCQRRDAKRLWIAHKAEGDSTLLTAETKRVRRFLSYWADTPHAFEDWEVLRRISPESFPKS